MKRAQRTKLLIEVGRQEAQYLAQQIVEQYEVIELQAPKQGLVMIKQRESAQNTLFYIGETLVTETKVKIGNAYGIGIVRENEPELSTALAIIDAAYTGELPETQLWATTFDTLQQRLLEQQQHIKRSIERTKVQFDTMITEQGAK
ncbi:phosphonate C-P lyase system protein PhnG [Solibacillus sp. MA9]|uniref:Phosphonate C-P lyase system protein PhnG n=2 Tax=Solibacillus TaxID=648800 RepID=A0ABS9UDV2_9BACL|nr:phosphonate C-P lyase system protein PhnG [Solibacillus sp. MA9]